jgi:tetratricopeptide (TPR) repeat protein
MSNDEMQGALEKANIQLASGDFQKAYNSFKRISKDHVDVAEAYFGMAEASVGIPKLTVQDIASHYQRACDLDPQNPIYFAAFGNFCFENGIIKKGEECFVKASELDEENSAIYLSDLATNYYHSAQRFANHYPQLKKEDILQTSFKYLLMAFNIDKSKAKDIIEKL